MDVLTNKRHFTFLKTWTWLQKGNLKRETESLRMAAQQQRQKD